MVATPPGAAVVPPPPMRVTVLETADTVAAAPVVDAVPLILMALALKVSKDFSTVGLMAKTIPFPQWLPVLCLQYHPNFISIPNVESRIDRVLQVGSLAVTV